MVGHFSRPKEWVMDLLSGSGTGLASCMAYGRHGVAIEVDAHQAMVLKERVLQLVDKEDENVLDAVVLGETGSQPLLTLGSQVESPLDRQQIGLARAREDPLRENGSMK
jgi:hypothetical protein